MSHQLSSIHNIITIHRHRHHPPSPSPSIITVAIHHWQHPSSSPFQPPHNPPYQPPNLGFETQQPTQLQIPPTVLAASQPLTARPRPPTTPSTKHSPPANHFQSVLSNPALASALVNAHFSAGVHSVPAVPAEVRGRGRGMGRGRERGGVGDGDGWYSFEPGRRNDGNRAFFF
jgi:hypothetical protein